MELEELRQAVPSLSQLGHPDKIKLFGWYLHTHKAMSHFWGKDLGVCYDMLHLARPSDFGGYLFNLVKAKQLLKSASGYRLENGVREGLDSKYGRRASTVVVTELLRSLPERIPNLAERAYLDETLRCFTAEAFRASVVMCWNLGFDHLCEFVLADAARLADFNAQLPKSFPKADIRSVSKRDDFTELKESQVLQVCKSSNIISGSLHKVLKEKLDRRNIAAHPSGVTTSQPTAEEFVKDLIENVVLKLT
ncbi:MAG: hypothetical protein WCD04_06665 [Terriglobia bacterium]|jgi:hypothetical protein